MTKIVFLKSVPHLAEPLGLYIYSEWKEMYERQGKRSDDVVKTVKSRAVDTQIPCTLVALNNGELCGSVTLKVTEENGVEGLSPWLAGVFVLPQWRGRGIGSKLVDCAESVASEQFGVEKLYLYTSTATGLYEKHGWETFKSIVSNGKTVNIMAKELRRKSP